MENTTIAKLLKEKRASYEFVSEQVGHGICLLNLSIKSHPHTAYQVFD